MKKNLCNNFTFLQKGNFYLKKRLGINLEMIFRAADTGRKGLILLDEFRLFLRKLKLNLNNDEINQLL